MKTIAICCSASAFKQAIEYKSKLEKLGFKAIAPGVAEEMARKNDFNVSHYKTWWTDPNDYSKKAALIRKHFVKIIKADAVLVLNLIKHGIKGYIGGNTLMELAIAFHFHKPIFALNPITDDSPIKEEVLGVGSIFLRGDLSLISQRLKHI